MTVLTELTGPTDRPAAPVLPRPVTTLATLGDSTSVGIGDPVPGGGWRGFPVLLREALGASELVNPARTGARMAWVRHEQLPVVLAAAPQVAVLFVGMNDTLRSDFDPAGMRADCLATVTALRGAGAHVLLLRYHDHSRVLRMPAPLRRALGRRIAAVNAVTDAVAAVHPGGVGVLDLDVLPGGYERSAWAVDRLHPSELGHRLLADGFARLLAAAGFAVPHPVGLTCAGGREITAVHRAAWLVVKGVPWLVRRGRDLAPVIVQGLVDELCADSGPPIALTSSTTRTGAAASSAWTIGTRRSSPPTTAPQPPGSSASCTAAATAAARSSAGPGAGLPVQ